MLCGRILDTLINSFAQNKTGCLITIDNLLLRFGIGCTYHSGELTLNSISKHHHTKTTLFWCPII